MRLFIRAVFVSAALAAGAILVAPAQAGSVRGTVRDEATLAPLAGAWVTVQINQPDSIALSTPTDAEGRYEILNIPPGNQHYVVSAAAAQHTLSYASFDDLGSTDLTYDILLASVAPPPTPNDSDSTFVSGTVVVSSGSNEPVAGASVSLSSPGGSFGLNTDVAGHYAVIVPIGEYSLKVSASGYQTLEVAAVQVTGASLVLDAALRSTVGVTPGPRIGFALFGAVPHPLRADGVVSFQLPVASRVSLRLFDAAGRLRGTLLEGVVPQGLQSARLPTAGLASGVYMVRMEAAPVDGGRVFAAAKRVIVLR